MSSASRQHNEWLSLVDVSGPFLSMPVLNEVFPNGLDEHDSDHYKELKITFQEWIGQLSNGRVIPAIQKQWVKFILENTLEFPSGIVKEGQGIHDSISLQVSEYRETLRPDFIVINPAHRTDRDTPRLLVQVYPPDQKLESPVPGSLWKATPTRRMMELLLSCDVRLGLITNGEHWILVHAKSGESTTYASWYSSGWFDEKITLQAFRSLLCARRLFGVPDEETVEAIFERSLKNQEEVTDRLGYQVRKAVEVLVQELDRKDKDRGRELFGDLDEKYIYDAALTVMMRLVFLFSAEEKELILSNNLLYNNYYAVLTLRETLRREADQNGEEILERRWDAWSRLLATFRAVFAGVQHDQMQILAHGGTLFDPDRYPFLEGRKVGTSWKVTPAKPLPVSNRTVLHLLEALQILQMQPYKGAPFEARRLSFRALDIEQIGNVYERLLDHTAKRAEQTVLGFYGSKDKEVEIPLAELERLHQSNLDNLVDFLSKSTGRGKPTIRNALTNQELIDKDRLRVVCDGKEELVNRVLPYTNLLRMDTMDYPVVFTKGSVYVTVGTDRRTSGTHYTPLSLTEPIVKHALDPLVFTGPSEGKPQSEWQLKSVSEILELRICDPAMGSGAFLVQTCRYLSEKLMEAWEVIENGSDGSIHITPLGEVSKGDPEERILPKDADERMIIARRIVAEKCLFGVDKNPMAVEMAKLSIWLVTMAKGRPFTFLDHALKCGDSLLGLDMQQIETWSMNRKGNKTLDLFMRQFIRKAEAKRKKLLSISNDDIQHIELKENLHQEAENEFQYIKVGADLILAPELQNIKAKEKEAKRRDYLAHYSVLFQILTNKGLAKEVKEETMSSDFYELHNNAKSILHPHRSFHWPLEFPEIFMDGREGFDAIVSNPPFQGGQKITGALGTNYRDYLVNVLAGGQRGSADLCAYFYLRAIQLIQPGGIFAMLATNTISQGETREVGLSQIFNKTGDAINAIPSQKWPGDANLEVAILWITKGLWCGEKKIDNNIVDNITPYLNDKKALNKKPFKLDGNKSKCFQGSIILGDGFILDRKAATKLIEKSPENLKIVKQYLNGKDLVSRWDQSPSRWVIDFQEREEEEAKLHLECYEILKERVLPVRIKKNADKYPRMVYEWWKFWCSRPELYSRVGKFDRVLVGVRHTKYLSLVYYEPEIVFSDALIVFTFSEISYFEILQSTLHDIWAREFSGSLETRLRYSPSDCFETFPFPLELENLEEIGEKYYSHRQSTMTNRQEGLTQTYNRFHDAREKSEDIQKLRALHVQMDESVAKAYDWDDLDLEHGFHETKQGIRFTISESARTEILDRLLELNHERYAEEVKAGLHEKKK